MLARISYARYVITFRFNYYYRSAEDKQWRSKLNLRTSCRNLHFPWEFIRVVYRALIPFCLLRAFYVSFSFIILPATARNKLLRAWFTTLWGGGDTSRHFSREHIHRAPFVLLRNGTVPRTSVSLRHLAIVSTRCTRNYVFSRRSSRKT